MTCKNKILEDEFSLSLESKIDSIEAKLDRIEAKFDGMVERLGAKMEALMSAHMKAILDSLNATSSSQSIKNGIHPVVKKKVRFAKKVEVIPFSSESLESSLFREDKEGAFKEDQSVPVEESVVATATPISEGSVKTEIIVMDTDAVHPEAVDALEAIKELEPLEFIVEPRPVFVSAEANPDVKIPGCVSGIQHLIAMLGGSSCEGFFGYLKHNAAFDVMTSVIQIWPEISFAIGFLPGPPKKPPPWFEVLGILIHFSVDFVSYD